MYETLGNLEKVTVGLKWSELHIELVAALRWDFLLGGGDVERVLHIFAGGAVKHF